MSVGHTLKRGSLPVILVFLSIMGITLATSIRPTAAVPTGSYFDHIVIIAMENTPYASVFGSGTVASCPTSSAPFLCSMLPLSATMPYLNNYGATATDGNDFNGCSAACYVGLLAGYTYGIADGYGSLSVSNLVADRLAPAGLTWQAYCAEGCPRGNDHFPFTSFTDTSGSSNIFTSSSVTTANLVAAADSASPPNFLWYTPTDSENMHDVSVSAGDSYLQSFLVGSGSISAPASGSLLASNLFTNPAFHTVLYLWWDECGGGNGPCDGNNDVPNLLYGSPVKKGYVSPDLTGMDEYASLWTIENNWGLAPLAQGDAAAKTNGYLFDDVFGSIGPLPLSASFTYLPTTPIASTLISFTGLGVGGAAPYTYAWSFGDGSTGIGAAATHTYTSAGSYNVTLAIKDSASNTAKSSQIIQVSPIPTLTASFSYSPKPSTSGQSVTFSGNGSGGVAPYTYRWNFGDGGSSTSQSPTHTYATSGSFTVKFNVTDTLGTVATSSQSITVSPPGVLTASFTISPTSPVSGQSVSFTATASGGTGPYSYSWNLGGTSTTGNPVSHSFTNGTYTISLTVTDSSSKTATSSQTLAVLPPSTGGQAPVLVGWGGVRMDESVAGSSGQMSIVFSGEYASNMELLLIQLKAMGYNTVRVDFDPYCTDTSDFNFMSVYSQTNAQRAVQIAQHYGFWIILDYHGYSDIFRNTSCWLSYWKPIVQNIGPLYSQIIWEPQNEPTLDCSSSPSSCPAAPCSSDAACMPYLSSAYQQWINQTRSMGDTHWIVVQNLCSYACGFTDMSQGYPTVTDPLGTGSSGGKVFISLHTYMDYSQYTGSWTNSTADTLANQYYQAVVNGIANTGWPTLNTEGGTNPLCNCAPDAVLQGSAGYSVVTFHFIQTLVNLYDSNSPQRINWVWWPAGSWTDTPGAGIYGAMQCNSVPIGWGCLLTFRPLGPPAADFTISTTSPNPVTVGQSAQTTITIAAQNGFTGTVSLTDIVPTGLSCGNITPAIITGSGTASVSCSATTAGSFALTIVGTSGSLVHSASSVFNFQDFTVMASSPAAVSPGSSATSTITVSAFNGFSGAVALSITAPSGLSCGSLSHNSVSGSGTATFACNSASQNVYSVTVKGTSGSLSHTATAIFTFGIPPDFSIVASQPGLTNVGSSQKSTITITFVHGLTSTVVLVKSNPSGLSCGAITPASLNLNGTATISCTSQAASTYTLTISGTSGALTHTATIVFTFLDFGLTATPSSLSINTGSQGTSIVGLNLLNGFSGSVTLGVTSPNGITASLDSTSISGASTATLTVTPTLTGSYTIAISGTSGSLTRTVTLSITVGTQSSVVLSAPSTATVFQASKLTFSVNATDPSNTALTLTLTASGLPSGAKFVTVQGVSPVSGTFAWTPTTSNTPGTYTVNFSVNDGLATTQTYVVITVVSANVLPILNIPGPQNATEGTGLHFTISASDPTGTSGPVILSATGLASNMAFDPSTGAFTFTPGSSQAGQTYIVNFTATDSNNPSYTRTQSVPIHVQGNTATPSGGGFCLSCLIPRNMSATAWLVAIGALIGIASSIAILHIRASADLSAAKKRIRNLKSENAARVYNGRPIQQRVPRRSLRRLETEED